MKKQMMGCGHAANAEDSHGNPRCVICVGIDPGASVVVHEPSLTGRIAKCMNCCVGSEKPSDVGLAFFEYQGPSSNRAKRQCKHCGRFDTAHTKSDLRCDGFEAVGDIGHDLYYCGCRGWD